MPPSTAGADIFLREVQAVWPGISPYADQRVEQGAQRLGLSRPPQAGTPARQASLAAALVRLSRDQKAADNLKHHLTNH